jgi:flagellar hook-length control protein FliK
MMLNTVISATPAQPAGTPQSTATTPAAASPAAAGTAADTGAPAPAPMQPFALWLGQQVDGGTPVDTAQQSPAAAGKDAQAATAADEAASDEAQAAPAQDNTLLAAMALPLMPLPALQAAQALQAMVPASGGNGKDANKAGTVAAAAGVEQNAQATPRGAVQPATPAIQEGAPDNGQASSQDGSQGRAAANAANAAAGRAQSAPADAAAAATTRFSMHADAQDGAPAAAPAGPAAAGVNAAAMAGVPAPAAPAADTVKLAGPPTEWRQSLQEALGERLNVQVTKNMEQAVIRLEPPQLGRIDIAIRHSAGTLEVNISASNGEVLRQLQTVSDNLRTDLSQRQFTDVAVTVAPAPKSGANPFGDPSQQHQQQGRGRQQGRDQESEPGRALAEAGIPSSAFSLDGRA